MAFRPCTIALSSSASKRSKRLPAGSSFQGTARRSHQEGEVIAVGPGARDESGKLVSLDVKVGDRVLFGKWSGTEVKIDGQDLLIDDIMGIVETTRRGQRPPDPFPPPRTL